MSQKLFFPGTHNINLCGILSDPAPGKKLPMVILCHGFTKNKDNKTNLTLEPLLNQNNIATFRFDFFGHGESGGSFEDITITQGTQDILSAISFLKEKGYNKIGLVGSSFGGMCSIMAASKTKDLFFLALKAPVSNWVEMIFDTEDENYVTRWFMDGYINYNSRTGEPKGRIKYNFWLDAKENNGYIVAQNIQIPTLIVHGDQDKGVPLEQSQHLNNTLNDSELIVIPGADHSFTDQVYFEKMIQAVSTFVINQCYPKK